MAKHTKIKTPSGRDEYLPHASVYGLFPEERELTEIEKLQEQWAYEERMNALTMRQELQIKKILEEEKNDR